MLLIRLKHLYVGSFFQYEKEDNGVVHSSVMQVCNTSMVTPFKIVAKNEERGQPQASYLRYVKVYLPGDTVVELHKSRRVLVKKAFL